MAFVVNNQADNYGAAACHGYPLYRRAMVRFDCTVAARHDHYNFEP